jgi:hypothetical protein
MPEVNREVRFGDISAAWRPAFDWTYAFPMMLAKNIIAKYFIFLHNVDIAPNLHNSWYHNSFPFKKKL